MKNANPTPSPNSVMRLARLLVLPLSILAWPITKGWQAFYRTSFRMFSVESFGTNGESTASVLSGTEIRFTCTR